MGNQVSDTPAHGQRASGLLLVLLVVSTATGCSGFASMQDLHYSWTNKHRASAAWLSQTSSAQRRELGNDYAKGFKQGFYDASTGRGCKTPAVPPPCYWSTKYQSCDGQQCIQDWFRGYQCGVVAAEGKGFPGFHDVPVGPCAPTINNDGCHGCYSPDFCECGSGNCVDGQCSPGVHPDGPDMQPKYESYITENGVESVLKSTDQDSNSSVPNPPTPAPSTSKPAVSVPPAPDVTQSWLGTDEGYVTHTA